MLGMSALGSICLPWIDGLLVGFGWSGFIAMAVVSLVPLYYVPRLPETGGRVNQEVFGEWEKKMPLIPLENWRRLAL